jgi:hypothetical protein
MVALSLAKPASVLPAYNHCTSASQIKAGVLIVRSLAGQGGGAVLFTLAYQF